MAKLWLELKNNLRLRIALAVVVAILGWNALLDARGSLDAQRTSYRQAANQSARLANMKNWAVWPERAKQAHDWKVQGESRLWPYASVGLAQANLQDWLMESLNRAKAAQPAVALVEEADGASGKKDGADSSKWPADAALVRFKVGFAADGPTIESVLGRWLDNDKPWYVESLAVRRQLSGYKVEALVVTGVLIDKTGKEAKP